MSEHIKITELTKLEHFAIIAMQGVLHSPFLVVPRNAETIFEAKARYAVDMAYGLIAELERRKKLSAKQND